MIWLTAVELLISERKQIGSLYQLKGFTVDIVFQVEMLQ